MSLLCALDAVEFMDNSVEQKVEIDSVFVPLADEYPYASTSSPASFDVLPVLPFGPDIVAPTSMGITVFDENDDEFDFEEFFAHHRWSTREEVLEFFSDGATKYELDDGQLDKLTLRIAFLCQSCCSMLHTLAFHHLYITELIDELASHSLSMGACMATGEPWPRSYSDLFSDGEEDSFNDTQVDLIASLSHYRFA